MTSRFAESVARLCQHMAVKHVAQYFGLSWDRVKDIDKRWLRKTLGAIDLGGVEVIATDEFAIRGREDIRPFFQVLGSEGCSRIKAVAIWT